MNPYIEIKNAFQFLDCAVRQRETFTRCDFPFALSGKRADSVMRDYVFCLTLVSTVAQLEKDIETLRNVPDLRDSTMLAGKLRALRAHFRIGGEIYDSVDRIRDARNQFVHEGRLDVNPGCTKAEIPGIIVTFLQRCQHPEHT